MSHYNQRTWFHGKSGFIEYDTKYIRCCCHVRKTTVVLSVILLVFCIVSICLSSLAFVYPESHNVFNSDKINLEYKNHRDNFELAYRITVAVVGGGFIVHLFSLIVCLIGIFKIRPCLMLPELVIVGLLSGLLLFATVSLIISMIIVLGFLWVLATVNGVAVIFTVYYYYVLIYCYHYISDKRKSRDGDIDYY